MGLVLHVMFVLGVLTLANHEDMSLGDILPSCLLPAHCYANLTLKCYCALRARVLASSAVTNNVRLAMDFPRNVYFGATYSRQPGWTSFWGEHQLDITKEVDMAQHFCPGSVDAFKSEHTYEHIPLPNTKHSWKLLHRYLKPTGYFRMAIPSFQAGYKKMPREPIGHCNFMTHTIIEETFRATGYRTHFLEYVTNETLFAPQSWDLCTGEISRSITRMGIYRERFGAGGAPLQRPLAELRLPAGSSLTSHIVDAWPSVDINPCYGDPRCIIHHYNKSALPQIEDSFDRQPLPVSCTKQFTLNVYCRLRDALNRHGNHNGPRGYLAHFVDPWPRFVRIARSPRRAAPNFQDFTTATFDVTNEHSYETRFCPGSLDLVLLDGVLDGLAREQIADAISLAQKYLQPNSSQMVLVMAIERGWSKKGAQDLLTSVGIRLDRIRWLESTNGEYVVGKNYDRCLIPVDHSLNNPALNPGAFLNVRSPNIFGCNKTTRRYPKKAVNATSLIVSVHSPTTPWRSQYQWCLRGGKNKPPVHHRPWVR